MRLHGVPGGICLDEGSSGIEVRENVLQYVTVPLSYHNEIDLGYTIVQWIDNVLNKRPGDEGIPHRNCGLRRPEASCINTTQSSPNTAFWQVLGHYYAKNYSFLCRYILSAN